MKIKNGFTLIELLVAATIISILAAVAMASYSTATKNSRDARRKADIENVRAALEIYKSQIGTYPTTGSGAAVPLTDLNAVLVTGGYLDKIPSDPTPNSLTPYYYRAYNSYYGYCLFTKMEIIPVQAPCVVFPSPAYNYSAKNP